MPTFLAGVECRASSGGCDLAEVCGGGSTSCPPDQVSPTGTVCRTSSDVSCDPEESCNGVAIACPADETSCLPESDAGPSDGGTLADAGAPDAAAPDAAVGTDAGDVPAPATGCACTVGTPRTSPGGALMVMLAVALALPRRRR